MAHSFFTAHQRATVEAAMARIIPTDDTPGAREAGCIDFVDLYLSGIEFIFARPDGSGFEVLTGKAADAWRRRIAIMRTRYTGGVVDLNSRSRKAFFADFADLPPEQQDSVLRDVEKESQAKEAAAAAEGPALQQTSTEIDLDFFPLLVAHTRQGFYADPIYGGNRCRVGWQVIGFPGPASLRDVHEGRYTTLQYFAEGEAEKVKEFHDGL